MLTCRCIKRRSIPMLFRPSGHIARGRSKLARFQPLARHRVKLNHLIEPEPSPSRAQAQPGPSPSPARAEPELARHARATPAPAQPEPSSAQLRSDRSRARPQPALRDYGCVWRRPRGAPGAGPESCRQPFGRRSPVPLLHPPPRAPA
jgi:hypothetical protein